MRSRLETRCGVLSLDSICRSWDTTTNSVTGVGTEAYRDGGVGASKLVINNGPWL